MSGAGAPPEGPGPEPLQTVLLAEPLHPALPRATAPAATGQPVTGLRQALGAVRFYAGHQEAWPRPEPLHRLLWGAGVSLAAARLVATDRSLRRAALLPTALTALACLVMAGAATALTSDGTKGAAAPLQHFLVTFVALASLPPTLLQRLWIRVANQARLALGQAPGEDPFAGVGLLRLWWREGRKAMHQAAAAALSLLPFAIALQVLPFSGATKAVAAAAWAFYWLVVDAFELPMDVVPGPRRGAGAPWFARLLLEAGRLHRSLRAAAPAGRGLARLVAPWNEELGFTERHPWETAGFGLVMGTLLAVPVLGLFFRAVGITAATALLGRLDGSDQP